MKNSVNSFALGILFITTMACVLDFSSTSGYDCFKVGKKSYFPNFTGL